MSFPLILRRISLSLVVLAWTALNLPAQANAIRPLVTQPVDLHHLVTLRGNVHPLARPEFDQGVAPDDLPMERMLLVLQRGADQETALRQLLDDQQVKGSSQYHRWLTPGQFGERFGPADADIQAVTGWLSSQGFQVAKVAAGRTTIEFSGSAGLVRQVLGADIHRFRVNGADHWANTSDPRIPAALAPVVKGFASLNNFPRHQGSHIVDSFSKSTQTGAIQPMFTVPNSGTSNLYAVAPYDFATIYNVLPLWNTGIDGTGQTIAIVAESNINSGDVSSFQSTFGLPVMPINKILNGPDPGILDGEETEALLDVSWSGAVAKGATIDLVISETTEATQGIDLSALYIVDTNLAPVLSESYGDCEEDLGAGGNAFQYAVREQAAAQGITYINSSGDAGSARCDQGKPEYAASTGLAASGLASTPFNVAVGGTDFGDKNNWAAYWNTTNTSNNASAKSYIPETTWNATCAAGGSTGGCSNAANDSPMGIDLLAAGGGRSTCGVWNGTGLSASCAGGYPKPAWQTGAGVPSDGVRDLPDVSLFASTGTNGSFYVLCEADAVQGNPSCFPGTNWYFIGVGGTSVAAPSFAGIMALINQKTGQRQGNANYTLYPLAAKSGASCTSNAAAVAMTNCIFYDVIAGNNSVACQAGSLNCSNTSSSGYGILVNPNNASQAAWTTAAGYDLATGLGSLNVANLVNQWSSVSFKGTTTVLSSLPANITHGQPANFTVTVTSGSGTPTGDISLIAQLSSTQSLSIGSFTLTNGGTITGTTTQLPGGSYNVVAHYSGDGVHGSSDSAPHAVTVAKENSLTTATLESCDAVSGVCTRGATTFIYGSGLDLLSANITNAGGQPCASATTGLIDYPCPTGSVSLSAPDFALGFNLNSQGAIDAPLAQVNPGSYALTANYSGDNSYNPSTSASIPLTVTPAPTTVTLTDLPTQAFAGDRPLITIWAHTQSLGMGPSGTVQLLNNGVPLGIAAQISGGGEVRGNGSHFAYSTARVNPSLPGGILNLTAQYSGDSRYQPSTTAAATSLTVADFSVSASAATITIPAAGQAGTLRVSLTPQYGYTGPVYAFVMDASCPQAATCNFSPSTLNLSGTASVPTTLTINTTAATNVPPANPSPTIGPLEPPTGTLPWKLSALMAIVLVAVWAWAKPQAWGRRLATLFVVAGVWLACGGGGSVSPPTPPPTAQPAISLSPTSLSFDTRNVGTSSASKPLRVTNSGTANMTLTSVNLIGLYPGDFSQTDDCLATVAPNAYCTVNVIFTPTTTGIRQAAISFSDSGSHSFPALALSGTGNVPTPAGTYPLSVVFQNGNDTHTMQVSLVVQ